MQSMHGLCTCCVVYAEVAALTHNMSVVTEDKHGLPTPLL